jgi:hypothetical protein
VCTTILLRGFCKCSIKKDFEDLLIENESRPPEEQLPRGHFDIDPELRTAIKDEIEEAERVAVEEMRWETEKANLALEKLKGRGNGLILDVLTEHCMQSTQQPITV